MDWREFPYGKERVRLFVNSTEVARLCSRLDGTWYAALNQHYPHGDGERRDVPCRSFEAGKAGCEAWATRHMARLLAETSTAWERVRDRV